MGAQNEISWGQAVGSEHLSSREFSGCLWNLPTVDRSGKS